ncbi:hypothetical protein LX36DRAFT_390677 [Colletotrichum falcatum]|nr:hypothetical protein LX36DRAFT_390677 [Colletotrichum falcatum]
MVIAFLFPFFSFRLLLFFRALNQRPKAPKNQPFLEERRSMTIALLCHPPLAGKGGGGGGLPLVRHATLRGPDLPLNARCVPHRVCVCGLIVTES